MRPTFSGAVVPRRRLPRRVHVLRTPTSITSPTSRRALEAQEPTNTTTTPDTTTTNTSTNTTASTEISPGFRQEPRLTGRGDQRFVTRVWRLHDKDVVVLKNGFPLNFNGDYETGIAADIEQTRALMRLAAAQAVGRLSWSSSSTPSSTSSKTGIVPLSLDAQRDFARAFGIPASF